MEKEYKEVKSSEWKPEQEGDFIAGIYLSVQEDVGKNDAMIYNIETEKGIRSLWGSTVLDQKMKLVRPGDDIKIEYLGKKGERQYNDFIVLKAEPTRE